MATEINQFRQTLQSLGFDSKESIVYLSAFQLGVASAGEIAREAGLLRVTTYEVLKRLVKQGVASMIEHSGTKKFSVLSPDRLFHKFKESMDEFQTQLKDVLALRTKSTTQPKVSYYEGVAGLREVYEDFASRSGVQVFTITKPQVLYDALGMRYIKKLFARRKKIGVRVYSLAPDTPDGIQAQRDDPTAGRKTKLFPHEKYPIPNEVITYGNKVVLLSIHNQAAVIIESKEIAESVKIIWKMVWDRF